MEITMSKRNISRKHKIVGTVIKVSGRTVGQVIGNEFVKDFTNAHMLKNPVAIANDIQALHDAERAGGEYCKFTNTDTGIIYRAAIAKIWDMGKQINLGWGLQQMLTVQNWNQSVDPDYSDPTNTGTPPYTDPTNTHNVKPLVYKSHATKGVVFTPGVKQLDLFGGGK